MSQEAIGRVLLGSLEPVQRAYEKFRQQPIDVELPDAKLPGDPARQTTIGGSVSVTGPGTFFRRARRTLTFEPAPDTEGWFFERTDLPDCLPIKVSVHNVWTTAQNIVLCSGSPHNYMRMVEHIVALRVGMGIDNLMIRMDSGDPPLFVRGSMDLVEALEGAQIVSLPRPPVYVTVKEPVTVAGANGGFLTFRPAAQPAPAVRIDCAVDFPSAIGRQRARLSLSYEAFRHGAAARTNTTFAHMVFVRTIGRLFADMRNLGYTTENILVAGRKRYHNEAKLVHEGKSLEAVWHRIMLDLLAPLALIDAGRFVGEILSYKSGHTLDVQMIRKLYKLGLLETVSFPAAKAPGA